MRSPIFPFSVCWSVAVFLFVAVLQPAAGQDRNFAHDASGNVVLQTSDTNALPQILRQPQSQIVEPGDLASFSVVLADTRAVGYQWRFHGTNLVGLTNDALLLLDVATNNQGPYSVVVTNSFGSVTSAVAQLYLDHDRDGLPDSWEQTSFGNLTSQRGGGDADGDGVSNIHEFLEGTSPTNNSSRNFRLTLLADGGSVAVAPAKLNYTNGEAVILTAAPFPPNSFYGWSGDLVARTNPAALIMNSNKAVVANFRCNPAPDGMVSWWRGENNALDAMGANNGVLSNGLSFTQGQVGQAFAFTATNQEVKVAAAPALNVGAGHGLTIEAWIKPSDLNTQLPLFEWHDGTNIGSHIWLNVAFSGLGGPGCLYANLRDINGADHFFFSPARLLNSNAWQHVAVTYDRSTGVGRLFLNGLVVAQANLGSFVPRTTADLHLGFRPGSLSYAGLFDEPALYNRALTPPEILAIARADAAGKCSDRPIFLSSAHFPEARQGVAYTQQVTCGIL